MKGLKISKEIELPIDAVTQTIAAIGRKGAGKTYLASMIAEQMLDAKAQVVILDPIGNWYGLRIGGDGKSKGKDIFVIGGQHGDIPLVPEAGAKIARLLVERNVSVVLDISEFRLGERKRFATDFAEELLHQKKSARTPVHIFIEEAQLFIPQRVGSDEARMVGAFEQIVRLGRNYGIGATLITQRPQSVNKEVLSQVECLCVLQITGPHERKALEAWVQEVGADRTLVGELPSLTQGEGYVWSPAWLKIFKKVKFAKKTTFDTSATPVVGKLVKAAQLSSMDIQKLRDDMQEVVTQAEKDDPKALKKKIVELERQLKTGTADPEAINKAVAIAVKKIEVERFAERGQFIKHINTLLKTLEKISKISAEALETEMVAANDEDTKKMFGIPSGEPITVTSKNVGPLLKQVKATLDRPAIDVDASLIQPSMQRILNVLAWGESIGLSEMDKAQLALLSDHKPTSGGYANKLSMLRTSGWLDYPASGKVALTEAGRSAAVIENVPTTDEELHQMIFNKIQPAHTKILRKLIDLYPQPVRKDELAEMIEVSATSGGYANNLSRLRTLGLIGYPSQGEVVALPILFIE